MKRLLLMAGLAMAANCAFGQPITDPRQLDDPVLAAALHDCQGLNVAQQWPDMVDKATTAMRTDAKVAHDLWKQYCAEADAAALVAMSAQPCIVGRLGLGRCDEGLTGGSDGTDQ